MTKEELNQEIISQAYQMGTYNRKNQLMEEMAELTQALCKHNRLICGDTTLRLNEDDYKHKQIEIKQSITEEIADVEICLQQLKVLLEIDGQRVENIKEYKVNRTKGLLNQNQGNKAV